MLVLVALAMGAFWLCLAVVLIGGRLVYDLGLGSLRTAPEAWPVRGGESLPKRAAPALLGTEVATLAQPTRPAPRRTPVAPVLPPRPVRTPVPVRLPVVVPQPQPLRSPEPEPVSVDETPSHVAA